MASVVLPPNNPDSMPDPACASPSGSPLRRRSVNEPACCADNSLDSWLAPAGFVTRSDRPASSDGTAPVSAFCAAARSTPRNEAICEITSGVRNCITSEVRLTAMAISPLWLLQDCFVGLASDMRVHEDGGAASRSREPFVRSWLLLAPDLAAGFQQCDQVASPARFLFRRI